MATFFDELGKLIKKEISKKGPGVFTVPGLLKDHTLQLCPSGVVPWQAQAGGPGSSRVTAHSDYFIHLWRDRSGHVTWSVTKG